MTNREAIEWLAPDTSKLKINMAELNGENPLEYINEAIDIAINALEEHESNEHDKSFAQLMMSYNKLLEANNDGYNRAKKEYQDKHRWIPVSERLPNEEECNIYAENNPLHRQFLCTIKIEKYEPQTRQLFYSKVFGWKYGPSDYNEYVIAWMPLPDPYIN